MPNGTMSPPAWTPTEALPTEQEGAGQHWVSAEDGIRDHTGAVVHIPAPAAGGAAPVTPAGQVVDYDKLAAALVRAGIQTAMPTEAEIAGRQTAEAPPPPEPVRSPDGQWEWDGHDWQRVDQAHGE